MTYIYGIGNANSGLGQAQKCFGYKSISTPINNNKENTKCVDINLLHCALL
jgi:hypothetical protein